MLVPSIGPITLVPDGERDVVDATKATDMISRWKNELISHRDLLDVKDGTDVWLCDQLILSNKSYTADAASILSEFLTSREIFLPPLCQQIKKLDMSDVIASRMEDEGLAVLRTFSDTFLQIDGEEDNNCKLVAVDLSDNAMGSKGVSACMSVIGRQGGTLEELSLCNNGLSEASMSEVADILTDTSNSSDGFNIAQKLTKLHFFNNMSGDNGCIAFKRIASLFTDRLVDLRFSSTRAGAKGSAHILEALNLLAEKDVLINLKRLDLADNSFSGEESTSILSSVLSKCTSLQYLNLRDCLLEDSGIISVCEAIITSKCPLQHLDLSANEVTKVGAKSIAKVIAKTKHSLQNLLLEENEMTSIGVRSIVRALQCSDAVLPLQKVILSSNECGDIGAKVLLDILTSERFKHLTSLNLDDNAISSDAVEELENAFGDKLESMDGNIDDDDVDENLSDIEDDDDLDELTNTLSQVNIK
mmetsp:Transcript_17682/g.24941  ORF Transcript_17682/g.24941 Transcript_17682/m.24941 type:complete len:474 (+) Transcript_17682:43-1464(+)